MNTSKTKVIIGAEVGLLVSTGLVAGLMYALSANPARTANLRDIILIVLAFFTLLTNLLTGVLVAVLVYRAQALVGMVQTEVKPMLMQANQTIKVVRNTTTLVNENIARPAIRIASFLAWIRRGSEIAQHKISKRF